MKLPPSAIVAGLAIGTALLTLRPRRESFRDKVVVITGGSRGLGLELARLWSDEGAKVAICSRTTSDVRDALRELRAKNNEVFGASCDVTDQSQVLAFINDVMARFGNIDVLVNNAGIIQAGPLECMTQDDFRNAMATHFWGPYFMIQAALPHMRARQDGRIVNIASVGGRIPVPHLAPYCASKFALFGLSMALHTELSQHGISVTTVNPGLMRTGSARNALFKGRHREEYAWFAVASSAPLATMDSRRAARQIVEASRSRRAELTLTLPAYVAARAFALAPSLVAEIMSVTNRFLPGPGGIGERSAYGFQSESAAAPSLLTTLGDRAAVRNLEL